MPEGEIPWPEATLTRYADCATLPVPGFGTGGVRGGAATAGHVGMDLCWKRTDDNSQKGEDVVWT